MPAITGSKSFMSISGTKPAGFSPMTQAAPAPQLSPGSVASAAARSAATSNGSSSNSGQ